MSKELLAALGEVSEYQDRAPRVVLPKARYLVTLDISAQGVSDVKETRNDAGELTGEFVMDKQKNGSFEQVFDSEGEPALIGGSPYAEITATVVEGPFEGCDFRSRFWLTPGRGRNIGFVNNACKAITGRPVDVATLAKFGVKFTPGMSPVDTQQALRRRYLALDPETRLDFMVQYARVADWSGKGVVMAVGQEDGRPNEETGVPPVFNRIQGFWALADGKDGAANVRGVWHDKQTEAGIALGLLVEEEATA